MLEWSLWLMFWITHDGTGGNKWIGSSHFFKWSNKNIERHTAHTVVSWPNSKEWLIIHTSDLMMIIRQSIYILSIITRGMGKLKTHSPTYCIIDNWEYTLYLNDVFSVYPISLVMIERIYTLSYYHHQIGSIIYYPLFRVRSWNNGMRCMFLYILLTVSLSVKVFVLPWTGFQPWSAGNSCMSCIVKSKHRDEILHPTPAWSCQAPCTNMDLLRYQHGLVITCAVKCEMKLLVHSQTSTAAPLKFENG